MPDPPIANVDQVLLVFSLALPPFDPAQVTKFLVSVEAADLPVTLVLNKADLVDEEYLRFVMQEVTTLSPCLAHTQMASALR